MSMLIDEIGLKQINEYIENKILNFWCNVANLDKNKISTILYKWGKVHYNQSIFRSVWLDKVKASLDSIGMSNCFNKLTNTNSTWIFSYLI